MLLGCLALLEPRPVSFEDLTVVGKLFRADSLPAMVAEPGLNAAAACERNVGVESMMQTVVGGILLKAATITMKRFVAVWSLAVAEFITVFGVAGGALGAHSAFTAARKFADIAHGISNVPAVAFVLGFDDAVLPTLSPFLVDL